MAKFPYTHSAGPLMKAVEHLRKSFPGEVTAETLKKLGVAPKNESYVINVLRFLGLIDEDGKKVPSKAAAFNQHSDEEFSKEFSKLVKDSYGELFDLYAEGSWSLDQTGLITFFRNTDQSSAVVGKRQAVTFECLAALAGHSDRPKTRERTARNKLAGSTTRESVLKLNREKNGKIPEFHEADRRSNVGLTVRVEVNLPPDGDQQTYDRIFRSIRENLIDGK